MSSAYQAPETCPDYHQNMNIKPASLTHAFRHPLMIGSIVLLLVNDHLLKAYSPSWLTGKLSDFAGLFFFPFLLALALHRVARDEDRALRWGLALTGLVFAAIKTLPEANAAFTGLVSRALGPSVRFVLDPTDLIAMAVLPAAWLFWKKLHVQGMRDERGTAQPGKLAYAVMALGSLAALATSPCPLPPEVSRLVVQEGRVYANAGYPFNADRLTLYAFSGDGNAWSPVEQPAEALVEAFKAPAPKLPITQCDPADPQICYRVSGGAGIEESSDGGQTWQTSWQYPPGRGEFQARVGIRDSCKARPEQRFDDLVILSKPGSTTVVASAGNQGVLVRRPGEGWQRMGVGAVKPVSMQSSSLEHAFGVIGCEFITAGVASLLAYTIFSILGRAYAPVGENGKRRNPAWALPPALFVLAWLLAVPALVLGAPNSMAVSIVHSLAVLALLIMLIVLLVTAVIGRGAQRKAGLLALAGVFAVLAIPVFFFLEWALGAITGYTTAQVLAIGVTLVVFAGMFYWVRRVLVSGQEEG